jgi:hypothetical protein
MDAASAILVFPEAPDLRQLSGHRLPLTFRPPHPQSTWKLPHLIDGDGLLLNLEAFRRLRVKLGAYIETDNEALVRQVLGLPADEPGIVESPPPGKARYSLPS